MRKIKKEKRKTNDELKVRDAVWYRKKIVEMVKHIENEKYLKMIYGYTSSAYRENKSRD